VERHDGEHSPEIPSNRIERAPLVADVPVPPPPSQMLHQSKMRDSTVVLWDFKLYFSLFRSVYFAIRRSRKSGTVKAEAL
jgi:hypothetical protein